MQQRRRFPGAEPSSLPWRRASRKKIQEISTQKDKIDFELVELLKSCAQKKDVCNGIRLHSEVLQRGLLQKSPHIASSLINMYAKCGLLVRARNVLEDLHARDVFSWSALIAGYAQHGHGHEALRCFSRMKIEGLSPNVVTFISILKGCGSIGDLKNGEEICREIIIGGLLAKDVMVGTALVDMYAKCGMLTKARIVLEQLPVRNIVSWNALIAGYSHHDQDHEALMCLELMQREGLSMNEVTFTCILKACGNTQDLEKGKQIHNEIIRKGLFKNIVLSNALVFMYAKCGMLVKARVVLEDLPHRNVISWSTIIAGYAQDGQGHEALLCFEQMRREGLSPNDITFICILKAIGATGAIQKGKEIHDEIVDRGLLKNNIYLGNALVDMYAKCGALTKAKNVFEELQARNIVSWNALIAGYAQNGRESEALSCFSRALKEGLSPNEVTFLCVLNACNHSRKLDEAQTFYDNMNKEYGIIPMLEHHTCMVVMLGYFGNFDKAISIIKTMPFSKDPSVWLALLATCRKWENVKVAKLVFNEAIKLDCDFTQAYVLLSGIYAAVGMHEDAKKVKALRVMSKRPG